MNQQEIIAAYKTNVASSPQGTLILEKPSAFGVYPVHREAHSGNLEVIKYLVAHAPSGAAILEAVTQKGDLWNVACIAAQGGFVDILEYLVESLGKKMLGPISSRMSPAYAAAFHGRTEVLKFIQRYASLEYDGSLVSHLPRAAAINGKLETLKYLVGVLGPQILTVPSPNGDNWIIDVFCEGELDVVKYIIETAPEARQLLTEEDASGRSCVFMAAVRGYIEGLEYLVSLFGPAILEVQNSKGLTATNGAVFQGHIDTLKYLIAHAPSGDKILETNIPLAKLAIENNKISVLEYLVSLGKNHLLEIFDAQGLSPASKAICTKNLDILKYLVAHAPSGAAILEKCQPKAYCMPPWIYAVSDIEILKYVVSQAPSGRGILEKPHDEGHAPIHKAAQDGKVEILKYLVENAPSGRAILEHRTDRNNTPAIIAAANGRLEALKYIVETAPSGKEILKVKESSGATAGQIAFALGEFECWDYIVSLGGVKGVSKLYDL